MADKKRPPASNRRAKREARAGSGLASNIPPAAADNPVIGTEEPPGYAEYAVVFEAESAVLIEQIALGAMRALTTEQLNSLIWIGLLDEGFSRVVTELDERAERGEEL